MSSRVGSRFRQAMTVSNASGLAADTLLAWIAASQGMITTQQHQLLRDYSSSSDALEMALGVVQAPTYDDLKLACKAVHGSDYETRQLFLRRAFAVAKAGTITAATNYLLRFFADLTELNLEEASAQAELTLPLPGDPSSTKWWQSQQGGGKKKKRGQMSAEEAAQILGFASVPNEQELAKAFRRLASLHHPDRFAHVDEEEQRKAAKQFARIRAAFEVLTTK
ncbi:MAG: J domain-containing protein [Planctomycetota bacterium]